MFTSNFNYIQRKSVGQFYDCNSTHKQQQQGLHDDADYDENDDRLSLTQLIQNEDLEVESALYMALIKIEVKYNQLILNPERKGKSLIEDASELDWTDIELR